MDNTKIPNLRKEVLDIEDKIIEIRRHIHMYPETKYEEFQTAKYIVENLKQLQNIQIITEVGKTGVVAILQGQYSGPCVLLRADMDALDLQEDSNEVVQSQYKGKQHACGHDGHVAMLLGAAIIIDKWKNQIKGTIKFIFQPAEEGGHGAREMINDKIYPVLQNPFVDFCFAIHLTNGHEYPFIGLVKGGNYVTANVDNFYIDIQGIGSHGSKPHYGIDSVMIGCQLVNTLYTIHQRNVDPMKSVTINVGVINGGSKPNILAEKCHINGTVRSFGKEDRKLVQDRIQQICQGFELTYNCQINLKYDNLYIGVYNWEDTNIILSHSAEKIYCVSTIQPDCAGEDFSYFSEKIPSSFFGVGSAPNGTVKDGGKTVLCPHHSPLFRINEQALLLGASVWVQLIEDLLINKQQK